MVPFWVPNIVRNLKFRDHNFDNHPHDVRHACLTRGLFNIRTCESSHIVREHDQPRTGIESQVSDPVESSDSCTETEGFPRRNRYKKEWFRLHGADRLTVSGKLSDQHHRQARRLSHALVDPRKPRPPWPPQTQIMQFNQYSALSGGSALGSEVQHRPKGLRCASNNNDTGQDDATWSRKRMLVLSLHWTHKHIAHGAVPVLRPTVNAQSHPRHSLR